MNDDLKELIYLLAGSALFLLAYAYKAGHIQLTGGIVL